MTRDIAKLSISPESSDGFASVGTILPKEEAALLPGGFFAFRRLALMVRCTVRGFMRLALGCVTAGMNIPLEAGNGNKDVKVVAVGSGDGEKAYSCANKFVPMR